MPKKGEEFCPNTHIPLSMRRDVLRFPAISHGAKLLYAIIVEENEFVLRQETGDRLEWTPDVEKKWAKKMGEDVVNIRQMLDELEETKLIRFDDKEQIFLDYE